MIKLSLKLVVLLVGLVSLGVIWNQTALSFAALTRVDPLPETRELVAQERYAEAAVYLDFFMDYDYVHENPEAQALNVLISEKRDQWSYQLEKLREGLVSGTSDETIGQAAGITTDFFMVGDIRDLVGQGVNRIRGDEVDEVVAALSAVGLAVTGVQLASGVGTVSTAGAASPALIGATVAKFSAIALKTARKLGKLPSWLSTAIVKASKQVKQTKSLAPVTGILGDVHILAKTPGGLHLLSQTENAVDLKRMSNFAGIFDNNASAIYRVAGNTAVEVAQRSRELGKESIMLAATFGKKGLRLLDNVGATTFAKGVSRAGKIAYKGDIFSLIAKLLLQLPIWLLYMFVALMVVMWLPKRLLATLGQGIKRNISGRGSDQPMGSP